MNENKLTIVCTSNQRYIPPTLAFLQSIYTNSPNVNTVLRLVNVKKDTINIIKHKYPSVTIIEDDRSICDARKIKGNELATKSISELISKDNKGGFKGVRWLYSAEAAYCSNIKYDTMKQLLDDGFKHIMYLDVDTIVRKDITSIIDVTRGYDLGMYVCENERDTGLTYHGEQYEGWHAGLIYINNSENVKRFIEEVRDRVVENIYDMEADEDELSYVYKRYDNIKIKELTNYYKDTGPIFNNESAIWSGQQEIKHTSDVYIEEYNKYS